MRKYIVLGLLSVFTLVGGTAVAAGLLVKQQQDYFFNKGVQTNEEEYFNAENWDDFDAIGSCGEDSRIPCHLPGVTGDLQTYLDGFAEDLDALLIEADERP